MNWRARLDSMRECPDSELTKPTKGLLAVLAVGDPALSQQTPSPAATPATLATLRDPGPRIVAESQGGGAEKAKAQRAHLLALAADEGLPAALVRGMGDLDLSAYAGLPDNALRLHLHSLDRERRMDAGLVPPEWGEPVMRLCEGCGPVLLWATCPSVVKACPWCFRRKAGKAIPRPAAQCGDCRHYLPDALNPESGMGGCGLGPGRAYWPMKRHRCAEWRGEP